MWARACIHVPELSYHPRPDSLTFVQPICSTPTIEFWPCSGLPQSTSLSPRYSGGTVAIRQDRPNCDTSPPLPPRLALGMPVIRLLTIALWVYLRRRREFEPVASRLYVEPIQRQNSSLVHVHIICLDIPDRIIRSSVAWRSLGKLRALRLLRAAFGQLGLCLGRAPGIASHP